MITSLLILILTAGLFLGVRAFRSAEGQIMERLPRLLIWTSAGACIGLTISSLLVNSASDWSGAKLAASVATTRGYPLYPDPETGVMNGWVYGPVGAIAVLPAAAARDPVTARVIGSACNFIVYFFPGVWLLTLSAQKKNRLIWAAAILFFAWQSCAWSDLQLCAFIPCADGSALGWAAMACAFLYRERSQRDLILSAVAISLSIWSKQNYIPLTGGLVVYLLIVDGWKRAAGYVGWFFAAMLVLTGFFSLLFGGEKLFFHMFTLASHQSMKDSQYGVAWIIYSGLRDVLVTSAHDLTLLCLFVSFNLLFVKREAEGLRAWFASRRWTLIALVAIFSPIASVPAYMGIGGWVNSIAPTDYFILLAAMTCAIETAAAIDLGLAPILQPVVIYALLIFGDAVGFIAIFLPSGVLGNWKTVAHPYQGPEYAAFEFTKKHPAQVYFPWDPMVTLMAEGRLYHFEWGYLDRYLAGRSPSAATVTAHLPAQVQMIVYTAPPQSTAMLDVLGNFHRQIEVPEMPGCIVFVRGNAGQ